MNILPRPAVCLRCYTRSGRKDLCSLLYVDVRTFSGRALKRPGAKLLKEEEIEHILELGSIGWSTGLHRVDGNEGIGKFAQNGKSGN